MDFIAGEPTVFRISKADSSPCDLLPLLYPNRRDLKGTYGSLNLVFKRFSKIVRNGFDFIDHKKQDKKTNDDKKPKTLFAEIEKRRHYI